MNEVICGNNVDVLKGFDDNTFDLTVTSPPYDKLRSYEGYSFDFENLVKELFRTTKEGGVVVWVVGDAVVDGGETGTSFRHALGFMNAGFKLHDTMIYSRWGRFPDKIRYKQMFEYMFVFCKGKIKTANIIKDVPNKEPPRERMMKQRRVDGSWSYRKIQLQTHHDRGNIWHYKTGGSKSSKDKIAFEHPAIFPEELAKDHIIAWSNEGDLVLDPFCGSGTTLKMAKQLNRNYVGIDISGNYCELSRKRVELIE